MRPFALTLLLTTMVPMAMAQNIDYSKLSSVTIGGKNACIDPTGKVVLRDRELTFCGGLFGINKEGIERYLSDGLWGYRSVVAGAVLISARFNYVQEFDDSGLAPATNPGSRLFGLINKQGAFVIPPEYESLSTPHKNGLAVARKNGLYGYINKDNKAVIPFHYKYATKFYENGLASVEVDGIWRVINGKGEVVPGFASERAFHFEAGLSVYQKGGLYGYMDDKGTVVIEPKYPWAYHFHPTNGTAGVFEDGACRLIDRTGQRLDLPASRSLGVTSPLCFGFGSDELAQIRPVDRPDDRANYFYINRDGKIISKLVVP